MKSWVVSIYLAFVAFQMTVFQAAVINPAFSTGLPSVSFNDALSARSIQSSSGQFIVTAPHSIGIVPRASALEAQAGLIALTPELLVLSLERIKSAVLEVLGMPDRWRGKIRVTLTARGRPDQPFLIQSTRYARGWNYRVVIPAKIPETRFLNETIRLLLVEIANRMAIDRSAEIPAWLVDGLHQEVVHSSVLDLSVSEADLLKPGNNDASRLRGFASHVRADPLAQARIYLTNQTPLTATELFIPEAKHATGAARATFRHCAQLFLHELLKLPNARHQLQSFLSKLPRYWNWQNAFFEAFNPPFQRMLDVEKWWAIASAEFLGGSPELTWPMDKSLQHLARLLQPAAHVGFSPDAIPQFRQFSLQRLVREWDLSDQEPILRKISNQLLVLRANAPIELSPLIDDYRAVVNTYLEKRAQIGYEPIGRGQLRLREAQVVQEMIRQLDKLDAVRLDFKALPTSAG